MRIFLVVCAHLATKAMASELTPHPAGDAAGPHCMLQTGVSQAISTAFEQIVEDDKTKQSPDEIMRQIMASEQAFISRRHSLSITHEEERQKAMQYRDMWVRLRDYVGDGAAHHGLGAIEAVQAAHEEEVSQVEARFHDEMTHLLDLLAKLREHGAPPSGAPPPGAGCHSDEARSIIAAHQAEEKAVEEASHAHNYRIHFNRHMENLQGRLEQAKPEEKDAIRSAMTREENRFNHHIRELEAHLNDQLDHIFRDYKQRLKEVGCDYEESPTQSQ